MKQKLWEQKSMKLKRTEKTNETKADSLKNSIKLLVILTKKN
jgi:hypothetical protein